MTPEEATKELYRTIFRDKEYTKIEDVERLVTNGAQLTGNVSPTFGLPIMMAIDNRCDLQIIELMVKHGGVDMNYKIPQVYYNSIGKLDSKDVELEVVIYYSILNIILLQYYESIGNSKIINSIFKKLYEQKYIDKPFRVLDKINYRNKEKYNYIIECCKLLNIDIYTLETSSLELPLNLKDDSIIPNNDPIFEWE
jgi:hypothetical protein